MADFQELCPKCHSPSVLFDDMEGLTVCEACGAVIDEVQLTQHVWALSPEDGHRGVFVGAGDSGRGVGTQLLKGSGVRIPSPNPQAKFKLKSRLREVADQLRLSQPVIEEALHHQEQLYPLVMGSWKHDEVVASAVYIAVRTNQLPLSLSDLSSATATDRHVLGKYYRWALMLLKINPPRLEPETLLALMLDRVGTRLKEKARLAEGATLRHLQPDASLLLHWMSAQFGHQIPQPCVAAAIILAAEMCNVPGLGPELVAPELSLNAHTVRSKILQVRNRLLELAQLVPYGSQITRKNVGTHARTLLKLSGLLSAARGTAFAIPVSGVQEREQVPQQAQQQQQQDAGAVPELQQQDAGAAPGPQHAAAAAAGGAPGGGGEGPSSTSMHRAEPSSTGQEPRRGRSPVVLARGAPAASTDGSPGSGGGGGGAGGHGRSVALGREEDLGDDALDALDDEELSQYLRKPYELEFMRVVLEERLEGLPKASPGGDSGQGSRKRKGPRGPSKWKSKLPTLEQGLS